MRGPYKYPCPPGRRARARPGREGPGLSPLRRPPMSGITRRTFHTAAAAAGLAGALSAGRVRGANDRVRLGFIGLGNRGDQVLSAFLTHKDAEVVAVCDLMPSYLDFAARKIGT